MPRDSEVFITGYPSFLSPLAKTKSEADNFSEHSECEPVYAEPEGSEHRKNSSASNTSIRFELYINGIEIANGCEENRDPNSIKIAFEKENKYRQENNLPFHTYSEKFIADCSSLPPSSGLGLGLNRLLNIIKES